MDWWHQVGPVPSPWLASEPISEARCSGADGWTIRAFWMCSIASVDCSTLLLVFYSSWFYLWVWLRQWFSSSGVLGLLLSLYSGSPYLTTPILALLVPGVRFCYYRVSQSHFLWPHYSWNPESNSQWSSNSGRACLFDLCFAIWFWIRHFCRFQMEADLAAAWISDGQIQHWHRMRGQRRDLLQNEKWPAGRCCSRSSSILCPATADIQDFRTVVFA